MLQIRIVTYIFILCGVQHAISDENISSRRTRQLDELANVPVPRGFVYTVEDEDQQSSHFRKEHRDLNGVVRGSYGLKDPNGSFRLVSYIADDKGFRAHVSSNEHGIGRQSPANVRLNRLTPLSPTITDTVSSNPSVQYENQDNSNASEDQEWPSNYDYYVPLKQKSEHSDDESKKVRPLDLQKHLLDTGFYDGSQVSKQNVPHVDSPWGSYNRYLFQNRQKTDANTEESDDSHVKLHDTNIHKAWPRIQEDDFNFKSPATTSTKSRDSNNFPSRFINENFPFPNEGDEINRFYKSSSQIPSGILNILLSLPQQKVHTNLPDCASVSSGVLCKPPAFYYLHYNLTDRRLNLPIAPNPMQAYKKFSSDDRRELIETALADRLYKFVSSSDKKIPSDISPGDFASQNDLFKHLKSLKGLSHEGLPCSGSHKTNVADDIALTTSLNRPVIYNTISNTHINSLMKYGDNWNQDPPTNNVHQNNEQMHSRHNLTPETNNNKFEDTNAHKKLVLLDPQNSRHSNNNLLDLLNNLKVLGFIILSKDDVISRKGLSEILVEEKTKRTKGNGISEEATNKPRQNATEADFRLNANSSNASKPENNTLPNSAEHETNINISNVEPFTPNKEEQMEPENKLLLKNSEFLILDDGGFQESGDGDYGLPSTTKTVTSTDTPNWRKFFEDEMKQEYGKSLTGSRPYNVGGQSLSSNGTINSGIPNERVFNIQDPPVPLYDSRGMPVKSENVPLHLHRYIAPTGITSFPWKFAIPRPAPPRSLVIPPKPSGLS